MGKVRTLIVDDHSVVRQGLHMFLALDPEIEIVGEAASGEEAIKLARDLRPDVVLMDLLMPGMGGEAAIRMIRGDLPDVEVGRPDQRFGGRSSHRSYPCRCDWLPAEKH